MKKEGVCGMDAATQRPHIVGRQLHNMHDALGDPLDVYWATVHVSNRLRKPRLLAQANIYRKLDVAECPDEFQKSDNRVYIIHPA